MAGGSPTGSLSGSERQARRCARVPLRLVGGGAMKVGLIGGTPGRKNSRVSVLSGRVQIDKSRQCTPQRAAAWSACMPRARSVPTEKEHTTVSCQHGSWEGKEDQGGALHDRAPLLAGLSAVKHLSANQLVGVDQGLD